MEYDSIKSLEHIALVKICYMLWNQDDIRALIEKVKFGSDPSQKKTEWLKIEDRVVEKIPLLPLPKSLKSKVLCFIKPIGIELMKWMENHFENGYLCVKLLNEIFWTPEGTIDKKKTVETLVRNENTDILIRLRMGKMFGMFDILERLEQDSPKDYENFLDTEQEQKETREQIRNFVLCSHRINARVARGLNSLSLGQTCLKFNAAAGHRGAVEYMLQNLPAREKEESLVMIAKAVAYKCDHSPNDFPTQPHTDILGFLFLQMNKQQQEVIFQSYPCKVLKSLLCWPWQSFFTDTIRRMQQYLPQNALFPIMRMIICKMEDGFKDYDYLQLFREFCQLSSHADKRSGIGKVIHLMRSLLFNKDKTNIELIFKDLTPSDKNIVITCGFGKVLCECMIDSGEWDLIKFFIKECILSKLQMMQFQETFKKNVAAWSYKSQVEKEKWVKFLHLLHCFICKFDKRECIEDDECNPAKRHCDTQSVADDSS